MTHDTGAGRGTVLALDYPGRRVEAHISDLRLEEAGWPVRYLMAPPMPQVLTSREYADALTAPGWDGEAVAILAYCAAAPVAQDIAATLAIHSGQSPALMLFDGEPSYPQNIGRDLRTAAAQVGGAGDIALPPDDTFTSPLLSARPAECVARMRRCLLDAAIAVLRADGADDDEAQAAAVEITGVYLDWLVFLVAAHNAQWPEWPGEAIQIASRDQDCADPWPGARGTTVHRFATGRNELLGDPDVRRLVLDLLATATATADRRRFAELERK